MTNTDVAYFAPELLLDDKRRIILWAWLAWDEHGTASVYGLPRRLWVGDDGTLRVFVDKSVVEVFANVRQAICRRIFPEHHGAASIELFSVNGNARIAEAKTWEMISCNPYQ